MRLERKEIVIIQRFEQYQTQSREMLLVPSIKANPTPFSAIEVQCSCWTKLVLSVVSAPAAVVTATSITASEATVATVATLLLLVAARVLVT